MLSRIETRKASKFLCFSAIALSTAVFAGCNSPDSAPDRSPQGQAAGASCKTSDSNTICLGLNYITYKDPQNNPVAETDTAVSNVVAVNELYKNCGIAFQIDNFESVSPSAYSLNYSPNNFDELDAVRRAFKNNSMFLTVTTGTWEGSLHSMGANAWTQPPEADIFGVVMEAPVAANSNILGHELGHYLNLLHVSDVKNLLNPMVYSYSTGLSSGQCQAMRDAAQTYWPNVRRQ